MKIRNASVLLVFIYSLTGCGNFELQRKLDDCKKEIANLNKANLELKSRPDMRHDISFNVASFLTMNYIPYSKTNTQGNESSRFGLGGFIDRSTLNTLASSGKDVNFFLCMAADNHFYLSILNMDYNQTCDNKIDNCNIQETTPLFITTDNITWHYPSQSPNYRPNLTQIQAFFTQTPFKTNQITNCASANWSLIKPDVLKFYNNDPQNMVYCNRIVNNDLDSILKELGQNGKGLFWVLGYDGSELKNKFRVSFFQVDKDGNLGTTNKIILERAHP